MKKYTLPFLGLLLSLSFIQSNATEAKASEKITPQAAFEKNINVFVDDLKSWQQNMEDKNSIAELQELVETFLDKSLHFNTIARRVMGKHFKNSSKEQFFNFRDVVRDVSVKTFVESLKNSSNVDSFRFVVNKVISNPKTEDKVTLETRANFGDSQITMLYYLNYFPASEQWLVENIVIEGVNLVITFRDQFSTMMSDNKDEISVVIEKWRDSVQHTQKQLLDNNASKSK